MVTLTEVFPCFFFSCKANARVKPAKTGHGPHSSQFLCCSMYFCVVLCIFVLFYVFFVLCYVFFVLFYVFLCCSMYFFVLCYVFFVLFYVFLCCSMYFFVLCYVFFVLFYVFLCCSIYCLFCDVLCTVCVHMCTELLSPGGYPIAVKYIISLKATYLLQVDNLWQTIPTLGPCYGKHLTL